MIWLLAHPPLLYLMSCPPQRSYTLIVEALDFNNETSGEYSSSSGISICLPTPPTPPHPCLHLRPLSLQRPLAFAAV